MNQKQRGRAKNRSKTIYTEARDKRKKSRRGKFTDKWRVDRRRGTKEAQRSVRVTKKMQTGSGLTFLKTGARGKGRMSK